MTVKKRTARRGRRDATPVVQSGRLSARHRAARCRHSTSGVDRSAWSGDDDNDDENAMSPSVLTRSRERRTSTHLHPVRLYSCVLSGCLPVARHTSAFSFSLYTRPPLHQHLCIVVMCQTQLRKAVVTTTIRQRLFRHSTPIRLQLDRATTITSQAGCCTAA